MAPVVADGGKGAITVPSLGATAVNTDHSSGYLARLIEDAVLIGVAVVDEDIFSVIIGQGDQVGGSGLKGHKPSIVADVRFEAVRVPFHTCTGDAYLNGGHPTALTDFVKGAVLIRVTVVDENVEVAVTTTGHQVGGVRVEGHVTSVVADRGPGASKVPLGAIAGDADPGGGPGLAVADKDIGCAIGVSGHQVVGCGLEGRIAPVGA